MNQSHLSRAIDFLLVVTQFCKLVGYIMENCHVLTALATLKIALGKFSSDWDVGKQRAIQIDSFKGKLHAFCCSQKTQIYC